MQTRKSSLGTVFFEISAPLGFWILVVPLRKAGPLISNSSSSSADVLFRLKSPFSAVQVQLWGKTYSRFAKPLAQPECSTAHGHPCGGGDVRKFICQAPSGYGSL